MIKAREIPWSPEWIADYQQDMETMDPMEFWILVEELELLMKVKTQNQTKKVKTHE